MSGPACSACAYRRNAYLQRGQSYSCKRETPFCKIADVRLAELACNGTPLPLEEHERLSLLVQEGLSSALMLISSGVLVLPADGESFVRIGTSRSGSTRACESTWTSKSLLRRGSSMTTFSEISTGSSPVAAYRARRARIGIELRGEPGEEGEPVTRFRFGRACRESVVRAVLRSERHARVPATGGEIDVACSFAGDGGINRGCGGRRDNASPPSWGLMLSVAYAAARGDCISASLGVERSVSNGFPSKRANPLAKRSPLLPEGVSL